MSGNNYEIKTRACPQCYLCGMQGEELYRGLSDRHFGASGVWNLKQCQNPDCGLVWLDPPPIEEDIALAYRRYYTHHGEGANNSGDSPLAYRLLRHVIWGATGFI